MSLPNNSTKWVPEQWRDVYAKYNEHSAWYSGEPNQLLKVYLNAGTLPTANGRFWAEQLENEMASVVHVPLASDIATFSADLLFSEEPEMKITEAHEKSAPANAKKEQERLEEISQHGGIVNKLLEAGETASALGGCFLKPVWDKELADYPILTIAQPDNAIPIFKFGILQGVLFHKVIDIDGSTFYRLCEYHGKGYIENGLYIGTESQIGTRVSLTRRADTADIQDYINTQIDDLLVRYVANKRPNRLFRGTAVGMSDFAGSESLLSALDSTMSSWIRDIELGRGRLIVPEYMLEQKNGEMAFDAGREIFTSLEMDNLSAEKAPITISQFDIRMEQHKQTTISLIERIVSNAGYAPQSFGLNIEGGISTQSHEIRERKTYVTKQKKERFFKSALEDILHIMLQIDAIHLGNGTPTEYKPAVSFSDTLHHDVGAIANTVNILKQAESASVKTRVKMLNPDWDAERVDQEVKDILKETGISVDDPMSVGGKTYSI